MARTGIRFKRDLTKPEEEEERLYNKYENLFEDLYESEEEKGPEASDDRLQHEHDTLSSNTSSLYFKYKIDLKELYKKFKIVKILEEENKENTRLIDMLQKSNPKDPKRTKLDELAKLYSFLLKELERAKKLGLNLREESEKLSAAFYEKRRELAGRINNYVVASHFEVSDLKDAEVKAETGPERTISRHDQRLETSNQIDEALAKLEEDLQSIQLTLQEKISNARKQAVVAARAAEAAAKSETKESQSRSASAETSAQDPKLVAKDKLSHAIPAAAHRDKKEEKKSVPSQQQSESIHTKAFATLQGEKNRCLAALREPIIVWCQGIKAQAQKKSSDEEKRFIDKKLAELNAKFDGFVNVKRATQPGELFEINITQLNPFTKLPRVLTIHISTNGIQNSTKAVSFSDLLKLNLKNPLTIRLTHPSDIDPLFKSIAELGQDQDFLQGLKQTEHEYKNENHSLLITYALEKGLREELPSAMYSHRIQADSSFQKYKIIGNILGLTEDQILEKFPNVVALRKAEQEAKLKAKDDATPALETKDQKQQSTVFADEMKQRATAESASRDRSPSPPADKLQSNTVIESTATYKDSQGNTWPKYNFPDDTNATPKKKKSKARLVKLGESKRRPKTKRVANKDASQINKKSKQNIGSVEQASMPAASPVVEKANDIVAHAVSSPAAARTEDIAVHEDSSFVAERVEGIAVDAAGSLAGERYKDDSQLQPAAASASLAVAPEFHSPSQDGTATAAPLSEVSDNSPLEQPSPSLPVSAVSSSSSPSEVYPVVDPAVLAANGEVPQKAKEYKFEVDVIAFHEDVAMNAKAKSDSPSGSPSNKGLFSSSAVTSEQKTALLNRSPNPVAADEKENKLTYTDAKNLLISALATKNKFGKGYSCQKLWRSKGNIKTPATMKQLIEQLTKERKEAQNLDDKKILESLAQLPEMQGKAGQQFYKAHSAARDRLYQLILNNMKSPLEEPNTLIKIIILDLVGIKGIQLKLPGDLYNKLKTIDKGFFIKPFEENGLILSLDSATADKASKRRFF